MSRTVRLRLSFLYRATQIPACSPHVSTCFSFEACEATIDTPFPDSTRIFLTRLTSHLRIILGRTFLEFEPRQKHHVLVKRICIQQCTLVQLRTIMLVSCLRLRHHRPQRKVICRRSPVNFCRNEKGGYIHVLERWKSAELSERGKPFTSGLISEPPLAELVTKRYTNLTAVEKSSAVRTFVRRSC